MDDLAKKKLFTELMDEIRDICDDLRWMGVDLSKLYIINSYKNSRSDRADWGDEFTKACDRLKHSGKDLSKYPIRCYGEINN